MPPPTTASPSPFASTARAPRVTADGVRRVCAGVIDLGIAAYTCAILLWAFRAVVDLGRLTPDSPEKPLLILLVLVPVRVAIGGRSWLVDRLGSPWVRARADVLFRAPVPVAITDSLFALFATRLATTLIAFVANLLFPPSRLRGFVLPFHRLRFMEIFAAWDSGWYFDIARHGYFWRPDAQSSIAFFPLYPMLMRAAAAPFGGGDRATWIAGIVVSTTAFLLALIALHRFTERVFGDREVARRTVLYVAIFPFSLFFTRIYAESVFLLLSVLAVSRAYDDRWFEAGLWGALATVARPNGILIGVPLAIMAIRGKPATRVLTRRAVALAALPIALGAYCAFVFHLSGDPLGWLHAESQWGYSIGHAPWQLLLGMLGRLFKHGPYDYFFVSKMAPFRLFHGVTALLFLVITPAIFKRLGPALGAYVLVSLLVPLSGNALEGVGRYASVLFPAFMLAGSARSQRLHEGILLVSALFLALFVCLFVTLRPIY